MSAEADKSEAPIGENVKFTLNNNRSTKRYTKFGNVPETNQSTTDLNIKVKIPETKSKQKLTLTTIAPQTEPTSESKPPEQVKIHLPQPQPPA